MIAALSLDFDPQLHIGELVLRWQALGVTIALLAAIGWAAVRVQDSQLSQEQPRLRLEDLLMLLLGAVPGAAVGGRLVHVVDYLAAYAANPLSIVDPTVGSLSLLGAVVGGLASSIYVAYLIKAPLDRWAALAAEPLLLALGLGKVAQLLGGSGQGLPFDAPWAVAFGGDGPWVSLSPGIASHPSQLYEAAWLIAGIAIVRLASRGVAARGLALQPLLIALAWFFGGRLLVGFTWRDPAALGPLNVEQILALVALLLTLGLAYRGIVERTRRSPAEHSTARKAQEPTR